MKEVTVIELSELTGLSRSKIYYLKKIGKLMILNGKINYEDALQVITSLAIKKTKINHQENFRHILNMMHLQNITLQKQLELAYEREKTYLAELASHRQSLLLRSTPTPFINENNSQEKLENDLNNIDENSLHLMQSENKNQPLTESCHDIKSMNETTNHAFPNPLLQNKMTLSETESKNTGYTEQKNDALGTELTQGQTDQPRTLYRRTTATEKIDSEKLKRGLVVEHRLPLTKRTK
ncbi:hypothetical protein F909_04153 [Acinetobacter sp. ANC 3929]|nr:hypothetical protein [uncultured Acinetobacter sp.]ENW78461.1 hypothetical protein F909_04153 [Acinetobacter sp. ANC 3929]